MANLCQDCKWWKADASWQSPDPEIHGCVCPDLGLYAESMAPIFALIAQPDFGCVKWEAADGETQVQVAAQALLERKAAAWDKVVALQDNRTMPIRELYADIYSLIDYLRREMEHQP